MTVRRLKTYAGSQGFVYQYYFVGKRRTEGATVFTFDVTRDRKVTQPVNISLSAAIVDAWGRLHARPLSDSEQYASVKLRLFNAFDELQDLPTAGRPLEITVAFLEESLASLGVE